MKFFLLLFLCAWSVSASSNNLKESPKELMDKFLEQITSLKDFMISDEKFSNPKNELEIVSHLKKMAEISKKVEHSPAMGTPVFSPSAQVLREHIAETERVFRSGNKNYARWMLQST